MHPPGVPVAEPAHQIRGQLAAKQFVTLVVDNEKEDTRNLIRIIFQPLAQTVFSILLQGPRCLLNQRRCVEPFQRTKPPIRIRDYYSDSDTDDQDHRQPKR